MPTWGMDTAEWEPKRRPGVGHGKGRGLTKPPLRRGKRKRR